ncbi:hypothetical protein ACHAXS_002885 [Conticribra weissflogii]
MADTTINICSRRSLLLIFLVTALDVHFCHCKSQRNATWNYRLHPLVVLRRQAGWDKNWCEPLRRGRDTSRCVINNDFRKRYLGYHVTTTPFLCFLNPMADVTKRKIHKTHTIYAKNVDGSNLHLESVSSRQELEQSTSRYHYDLTIIIPAYNEIDRIGYTLSTYVKNLQEMPVHQHTSSIMKNQSCTSGSVAIIVVDDGSTDGTAEFVMGKSWIAAIKTPHQQNGESEGDVNYWHVDEQIKCVSLLHNEGKGAAIERGVKEVSRTKTNDANISDCQPTVRSLVLVADADGSGDISCLNIMIKKLDDLLAHWEGKDPNKSSLLQQCALVVGHRENNTPKSALRAILSWGFRTAVSSIFIGADLGIRDTQCGMKLMTSSASTLLYDQLHLKRWTHDVEVIHRANLLGVPVGECAVTWEDKEGSKLVDSMGGAIRVSFVMLSEIARMRIEYAFGRWSVKK